MTKIVGRLSFTIQTRWLRFAASLEKRGHEHKFADLVTNVRKEAKTARFFLLKRFFKSAKKPLFKSSATKQWLPTIK